MNPETRLESGMYRLAACLLVLFVCPCLVPAAEGLGRADILFHAPLDGTTAATIAAGEGAAQLGLRAAYVPGVLGQALRVDKDAWADASELRMPKTRFTKDIDIYHDYGGADTVGALRYAAAGNIRAEVGSLAFWVKPLNWSSGGRDRFLVNLGMTDTLALFYSPYWAYDMLESYVAPDRYTRALNSKNPKFREGHWEHVVLAWRADRLSWWQNGVLRAQENEGVVPLAGATGTLAFGDGSADASAFDEITILDREVTDVEAKALFYGLARPANAAVLTLARDGSNVLLLRGWTDRILGVSNDDRTTVRLQLDDRGLHVRFVYPLAAAFLADPVQYVGQPLAQAAGADTPALYDDDYVAVDVVPGGQADVYSFAVNGVGTRLDTRAGKTDWNGAWESTSETGDATWTVELTIPFADLGGAPEAGSTWGINFRHGAIRCEQYASIWAFAGPETPPLATLRIVAAAPSVTLAEAADPAGGEVVIAGDVPTGAGLTARTEVDTTCVAELLGKDDPYGELDPVAPEGWVEETPVGGAFEVRHALPEAVAADLLFTLTDADGTVVYHQRRPFAYAVRWTAAVYALPSADRLLVNTDVGSRGVLDRGVGAEVRVRAAGSAEVLQQFRIERLTKLAQDTEFSTADLPPGEYDVDVAFVIGGQPRPPIACHFVKPARPVWLDAHVGVTDKVPAPWTPVVRRGDTLACWGREHDYAGAFFPRRVTVLDDDLLAAPIELEVNGATPAATVAWGTATPRRVEWRAEGDAGPVHVRLDNWFEFDGFTWFKVTVSGGSVDRLAVTIPFRREVATHWYSGQYTVADNPSGATPEARTTFAPRNNVRVGNMTLGLQWCWETEEGWNLAARDQALVFTPGADDYRVTLVFIDTPTATADASRTIAFGLQALPCKPYPPKGWREIWWAGPWKKEPKRPCMSVMFWNGEENWIMAHHNYPNQRRDRLDKLIPSVHRQVDEIDFFHCYKHFDVTGDANTPEYRIWGEEWRALPAPRPDVAGVDPDKEVWAPVCYGSDSYLEWYLYHTREYLSYMRDHDTLPTMIYIDCTGPGHCANPRHEHGWRDAGGNWRASFTVLSQRYYMQRLNQLFNDLGANTWITVHMSGLPLMAVWGYADIIMPGEQFASFFQRERARLDREGKPFPWSLAPYLPMDRFRAEFAGIPYGVPQALLDQRYCGLTTADRAVRKKGPGNPEFDVLVQQPYLDGAHHMTGICMVHDTINWGGSSEEQYAIRTRFKWDDDVRFRGYWENGDVVALDIHDPHKYVCSLAIRPERLLLMPFNDTETDIAATVTVDLDRLGFGQLAGTEVTDLLTGERLKLTGNRLTFTMPGRRIRLLCIGPEWDWAARNLDNGSKQ